MKFAHPEIETVIDTSNGYFNTLLIESQDLFLRLLTDIQNQINGMDGVSVLSENDQIIPFAKRAALLNVFVPFDLNQRTLINKIISAMEKRANEPELFEATASMLAGVENYLDSLDLNLPCEMLYGDLSVLSLLKASGIKLNSDEQTLPEKVLNYFELVTEFDAERLFFLVNIRSYLNDDDMELLINSILSHDYHVIDIETSDRRRLKDEFRIIIDSDLCEIV